MYLPLPPPGFQPMPQFHRQLSYDELFLPRPEFKKFNSNPLEFRSFILNFETYIESRVNDPRILFCLLLQHCEERVKPKIDHYVGRGEMAYHLAKTKLQQEYGRECVIADICEQEIKEAPQVKANDPESFKRFSETLERALVTLQNLSSFGSVNSLDTMTKLISKLPFELRRRWVKRSVSIEENSDRVAHFENFVKFVRSEAKEMNSLYGRRVFATPESKTSSDRSRSKTYNFAICATRPKNEVKMNYCWYCNDCTHQLLNCPKFLKSEVKDRSLFVKSKRLCYKCLSSKHKTNECTRSNCCKVEGCKGTFHHTLLHRNTVPPALPTRESVANESPCSSENNKAIACSETSDNFYFCVVPVRVQYKDKEALTYAFLDQGSSHSFCDQTLINALKISEPLENINLQTLKNPIRSYQGMAFDLKISSLDWANSVEISNVFSIAEVPVRPNAIPVKDKLKKMPHLSDLSFPTIKGATVTLLIGANVPELFCPINARKGRRGKPIAIQTPLGWSLLGPSLSTSNTSNCVVNFVNAREDSLQRDIDCLCSMDFRDGTSVLNTSHSKEDRVTYQLMESSVSLVDTHYQLPLPWKPDTKALPNNRDMALQRLKGLRNRLLRDQSLREKYVSTIEGYLSEGYAEPVPPLNQEIGFTVWFLPHHPVIHPKKPKIRVVFDCSVKYRGMCLNDALMQGPHLTNDLVGVLIRFRKELIAVTGDIRAMFHQVKVHPKDVNALRFLWWPKGNLNSNPMDYRMVVHCLAPHRRRLVHHFVYDRLSRILGICTNPLLRKF